VRQACASTWSAPRRVPRPSLPGISGGAEGRGAVLPPGECLRIIAAHFIEVWKPSGGEEYPAERVLARDGLLPVPGCKPGGYAGPPHSSTSAGRLGRGGNLVGLCAATTCAACTWVHPRQRQGAHGLRWQLGVRLGRRRSWRSYGGFSPVRTDRSGQGTANVAGRGLDPRSLTCDTASTYGRAMSREVPAEQCPSAKRTAAQSTSRSSQRGSRWDRCFSA